VAQVPGEVRTTTEAGCSNSRFWDLGEQEQQSPVRALQKITFPWRTIKREVEERPVLQVPVQRTRDRKVASSINPAPIRPPQTGFRAETEEKFGIQPHV